MFIALDIGGSNIRIATSESLSPINITQRTFFPNSNNFDRDFPRLLEEIRIISKGQKIEGMGIGIAGQLADNNATLREAPNFPTWNNKPIKQLVSEACGCNVVLQNDGVAGALGEAAFREYQEKGFIYLIWGTGIGGAEVIRTDHHFAAKQLHWEAYFPEWEKECGGRSIMQEFGKAAESLSETEWEEVEKRFARHFTDFLAKTKPSYIVFGGGVALNHSMHLYHAVEQIQGTPLPVIVVSSLGETANLMGAFYSLHDLTIS